MESRSTFVTVLAWVFIVGAGFTSVVSLMQVVMVSIMFSGDEFQSIPEDAPGFARFMQEYFHLFIYSFFALAVFTFTSSIALLKRKNWARLAFIGILLLGVVWQVFGIVIQFFMFSEPPADQSMEGFDDFQRMTNIFRWFTLAFGIFLSGLFIWIIRKLLTEPIISEFTLGKSSDSDGVDAASS